MSSGKPEVWKYFEEMNVVEFLGQCQYYKDKQEEKQRQAILNRK